MGYWHLEGGPLVWRGLREALHLEYESKKRKTRREQFLERMEVLIPWEKLLDPVKTYYPSAGKGRVPLLLGGDAASPLCPTLLQCQ